MNSFIFVVCGGKEHINELNISLKFLRHFSKYPIVVLTDKLRNEIEIDHDNIIDIKTPKKYTNHQAHLYLETGLPNFIPIKDEDVYCYLDSDIIAISSEIDNIFNEYIAPIRFSKDHCTIDFFSAGIMKCNCKNEFDLIETQFHFMQSYFPEYDNSNMDIVADRDRLKAWFNQIRKNPFTNNFTGVKYLWNRYFSRVTKVNSISNFFFDKSDKCWYNKSGQLLDYDYKYYKTQLWKKHNIRFKNDKWKNRQGKVLSPEYPHCSHLRKHLHKHYNITVPRGWQHWNGGVFLFKKESQKFMNLWHKNMINEFNQNNKRIFDDQGTLIAAIWQMGYQKNKPLSIKYNFIVDYGNKDVQYKPSLGYTYNNFKTSFKPLFLHVYHEWGNKEWDIWKSIIDLGKKNNIIDL